MLIRKTQLKRPASALAAGVACAIALSLATGPAFAEFGISNRQPRGDEAKPGARRRRADRPISSRRRRQAGHSACRRQAGRSVGPIQCCQAGYGAGRRQAGRSVGAVRCRDAGSSAGERQPVFIPLCPPPPPRVRRRGRRSTARPSKRPAQARVGGIGCSANRPVDLIAEAAARDSRAASFWRSTLLLLLLLRARSR